MTGYCIQSSSIYKDEIDYYKKKDIGIQTCIVPRIMDSPSYKADQLSRNRCHLLNSSDHICYQLDKRFF
jgi:hypothetical protein